MPRIQPWLFRQANQSSPLLATLLPACRDLPSARAELGWIRSHVEATATHWNFHRLLWRLCQRRGRGEPLQYILGSQPFGSLDIQCKPGVLIPRPETEAYTCHLIELIKSGRLLGSQGGRYGAGLNIVDFCTGTGCIPLLLFSALQPSVKALNVCGIDISPKALALARVNVKRNAKLGNLDLLVDNQTLAILQGDIFSDECIPSIPSSRCDLLVSNPPYVSRDAWNYGQGQLGYSVRKYEPRLALVPDDLSKPPKGWRHEDLFYARLLDVSEKLQPRVILLEVGDADQACRILLQAAQHPVTKSAHVEIWRDWPDGEQGNDEESHLDITLQGGMRWEVPVKGSGNVRAIFVQTMQT